MASYRAANKTVYRARDHLIWCLKRLVSTVGGAPLEVVRCHVVNRPQAA